MTVLHINTSITWRGGEQQLAYLLENSQVNNIVFCRKKSALLTYCNENKIDHFTFTNSINFIVEIKKIINTKNVDIIHIHDSNAHTKWFIFKQLTQNKIPVVLHRRVAFTKQKNYLSQKKYNEENIKKVICISEVVKKETEKIIDDKNKCVIIHSSIKVNNKTYERKINKIPKFVTTSSLTEEKNLIEFINIAQKYLQKKEAEFYIFGEGKLQEELQFYINNKNLQNHIFLKGFVKNINQQLYNYDLFLFTSTNEGLGTSILDAMNNKVPVVTNNFAAAKEIIENEKTGFIYKNTDDAIEKIESLMNNYDLRNTITENAFHFVQNYDIKIMQKKILDTYYLILNTI